MLYLGSTVAVAGNDASVKLYNIATGQVLAYIYIGLHYISK